MDSNLNVPYIMYFEQNTIFRILKLRRMIQKDRSTAFSRPFTPLKTYFSEGDELMILRQHGTHREPKIKDSIFLLKCSF